MGTQSNYALRLPISLKSGAEQMAREDGSTLNQFIVSAVAEKLAAGDRQLDEIIAIAEQELNEKGFRADDIQIRDADTLLELTDASQRAVILMAAWLGQARLIDNRIVTLAQ